MSFFNEFKRIFLHQWCSKNKWAMFLFPAVVALLIFVAFIQRDTIKTEYVIFFTSLYAFWLGLFASCQLVNGELESGEWSYWVLGFKRPFFKHICALMSSSLVITFLQLVVFISILCGLDILMLEKNFLVEIYINTSNLGGSKIDPILFNSPKLFAILTLSSSVVFAALSGVAIGTLFSTMFREPANSLKLAISFVVVVLISSYTVLKEDMVSEFNPVYISFIRDNSLQKDADETDFKGYLFLEKASYLFPQRYFFNLGRIFDAALFNKTDYKDKNKPLNKERPYLYVAFGEMLVLLGYFFLCIFSSYLIIKTSRKYYELR